MPAETRDLGTGNTVTLPETVAGKVSILLEGNDNTVILHNARRIADLDIRITGNGGLFEVDPMRIGKLSITIKNGGKVRIGRRTSIESAYILADGGKTVRIGEDCMISFNVQVRTTDAHGIYSLETGERLNHAADVEIADHVWIGQSALISKGARIGSNSVIGAHSFVPNQEFPCNAVIAGTPARVLQSGVIWDRREAERVSLNDGSMDPDFEHWWNLALSQTQSPR